MKLPKFPLCQGLALHGGPQAMEEPRYRGSRPVPSQRNASSCVHTGSGDGF